MAYLSKEPSSTQGTFLGQIAKIAKEMHNMLPEMTSKKEKKSFSWSQGDFTRTYGFFTLTSAKNNTTIFANMTGKFLQITSMEFEEIFSLILLVLDLQTTNSISVMEREDNHINHLNFFFSKHRSKNPFFFSCYEICISS